MFDQTLGYPGEGPRVKLGTINVTGAGSLHRAIKADSLKDYDVILVQEHHKFGEGTKTLRTQVHKFGWHSFWGDAVENAEGTGCSGGVGIMWRRHIAVVALPRVLVTGRAVAIGVDLHPFGQVSLVSIYGQNQVDLDIVPSDTTHVWTEAQKFVRTQGCPFLIGGDHNCPPAPCPRVG